MSRQDHEKNKRMRETIERLTKDPLCANCGQSYGKHKAFMENCPNEQGFSDELFFKRKKA